MADGNSKTASSEVERVLRSLASMRFGTPEERGAAMAASADAHDLIRRLYDVLRQIRRTVAVALDE